MVCSLKHLTAVIAMINASVRLLDGSIAAVTHTGEVKLSDTLVLINVLVVPRFKFNLISASQLTIKHNCFFDIHP